MDAGDYLEYDGKFRDEAVRGMILAAFSMILEKMSFSDKSKYTETTIEAILEFCQEHYKEELSLKGTRIVIFTKESNSDVDKMRQRGIDVVLKQDLTLCCSIIDKQQVWYGSINIFGYHAADDNAMRFCDTEIADNLLDMLCE